jgi:hypothetical protein
MAANIYSGDDTALGGRIGYSLLAGRAGHGCSWYVRRQRREAGHETRNASGYFLAAATAVVAVAGYFRTHRTKRMPWPSARCQRQVTAIGGHVVPGLSVRSPMSCRPGSRSLGDVMCGTDIAAEGYSGRAEGSGSDGDQADDPGAGPGVARRRRAGPRAHRTSGGRWVPGRERRAAGQRRRADRCPVGTADAARHPGHGPHLRVQAPAGPGVRSAGVIECGSRPRGRGGPH